MRTVLTIAGADPSGGAGIQADIKTFAAFGVDGLSAITSLTAQNRRAVKSTIPVPPAFLLKQVVVLLEEFRPDAVKIGMLATSANATAAAKVIKLKRLTNIVLDPVMKSSGGYPLIDSKGLSSIKGLLPVTTVVTPNVDEAEELSGVRIRDVKGMEAAAERIFSYGPEYVLVKGGHLKDSPTDVLYDGRRFEHFEGRRLKGRKERFHGTGCVLSAAIAAGLAKGRTVRKAVEDAKEFLEEVLKGRE